MPIVSLRDLVACFQLERVDDETYTAPNLEMPYYRVFGGQLLAQSCAIATADAPGKSVKSLHVVFPREGDLAKPVHYAVERPHDGRSFASRQIRAHQDGRVIMAATVSLHVPEAGGADHQTPMPEVPGPEESPPVDLTMIPMASHMVRGIDLGDPAEGPPELQFWLRAEEPLADDVALHQGLLAHATDLTLIGTALRPVAGLSQADSPERLHTAVTSHTLWFHAPFRMDAWILFSQQSPRLCGARGFGTGHAYTQEGRLVASYAQESMIRERPPR